MSNKVRTRGYARSQTVTLGLGNGSFRQVDLGRSYGGDAIFCSQCGALSIDGDAGCSCDAGGLCVHRIREAARLYPGAIVGMT
jgi:hypothetical protein